MKIIIHGSVAGDTCNQPLRSPHSLSTIVSKETCDGRKKSLTNSNVKDSYDREILVSLQYSRIV